MRQPRFSPDGEPLTTLMFPKPVPIDVVLFKLKDDTGVTVSSMGQARGQIVTVPVLKDVTVEEALYRILAQTDWVYLKSSDKKYVIVDRPRLSPYPMPPQKVERTIQLPDRISAADVRGVVDHMVSTRSLWVAVAPKANQIIVTGSRKAVGAIELALEHLRQSPAKRRSSPDGEPLTTLRFPEPVPLELALLKVYCDTGVRVKSMGSAKGKIIPSPMLSDVPVSEAIKRIADQPGWVAHLVAPGKWFIMDQVTFQKEFLAEQVIQKISRSQNTSESPVKRRFSPDGEPLTTLFFPKPIPIDAILNKITSDMGVPVIPKGQGRGKTTPPPLQIPRTSPKSENENPKRRGGE